jgi:hypothetical protein
MRTELSFMLSLAAGAAIALAVVPGAGSPAGAAQGDRPAPAQCPDKLTGVPAMVCACPSEATATGSVWGADVYTDDSAICRAALHAGAIGVDGGIVFVSEAPGQAAYPAVTRNSVASSEWGRWTRSIVFRPLAQADEAAWHPGPLACPNNAVGRSIGDAMTCSCSAEAAGVGAVWGSGPYTGDSVICRAAVHAGVIGLGGGVVHMRVVAGRDRYRANVRHNVFTGGWQSYPMSIDFDH